MESGIGWPSNCAANHQKKIKTIKNNLATIFVITELTGNDQDEIKKKKKNIHSYPGSYSLAKFIFHEGLVFFAKPSNEEKKIKNNDAFKILMVYKEFKLPGYFK